MNVGQITELLVWELVLKAAELRALTQQMLGMNSV